MTEGALSIRGSEEPTALPKPTTIAGTNTDGTLTAGNLSTPAISFTRRVTSPAVTDVDIRASFRQLTPGSLTGNIDESGLVTLTAQLRVDLHLEVAILEPEYDCTTAPVSLTVEGQHTGEDGTPANTVVLTDADFTVPPATATASCPQFIVDNINEQLAGSGHSLSMTMVGALDRAVDPGDPTVTTLDVSTDGPIEQGDEVTLTATVAPGPDAEEASTPAGFVTFLDGSHVLGTALLDETGTAALATTGIVAGHRHLRARYDGSPPLYQASTSAATVLRVIAHPIVTVDLPPGLRVGTSTDVPVGAVNTGLGEAVTNARLDVEIRRTSGSASIFVGVSPRVTLALLDDAGHPTPITLTSSGTGAGQRLRGSIGGPAGVPLAPGSSLDAQLRLTTAANLAIVGGLRVTVTLVEVDGGGMITGTMAQGFDDVALVSADRVETTISAGQAGIPEFEIPETPAVIPTRVRAGNVVALSFFQVGPPSVGPLTGGVTFDIAGRPLLARNADAMSTEWVSVLPTGVRPEILVPRDLGAGPHTLTVSYPGDTKYRPATASFPMIVDGPIGPSYDCLAAGTYTGIFRAQLEGRATLPTAAPAGNLELDNLVLKLHLSRAGRSLVAFQEVAGNPDREIDMSFGPEGTGTALTTAEANNTELTVTSGSPIDHTVTLQSPTGQISLHGAPGESATITVDELEFAYPEDVIGARNSITCTPAADPLTLGTMTVAGTTLDASVEGPVRAGDDVALRSVTLPASPGTVEFRDGGETIGVVPAVDGVATLITDSLAVGPHSLTATFRNGVGAPTTTSDVVDLTILVELECAAFAEPGNGAVVRLVYMELLGRCPDQAGYDHWTGRLDGGTTRQAFARTISRTPEAVGMVVDDAYRTVLGRPADPTGRAFWIGRLVANGRYDRLLADLAASHEFWTRAGSTNGGFVTRVYEQLLGRAPDQAGQDHWVDRLDTGTSRRALVLLLANQQEPLGLLVADAYEEILSRAPFGAERANGITHLRTTSDRSGLYGQLIATEEFEDRAQGFPNPED